MKALTKITLLTVVAVMGSYATKSCSAGATQKSSCPKKMQVIAKQQPYESDFNLWLLSSKFNY